MYIKLKKVWTKKIEDKEVLEKLWQIFQKNSLAYDFEWSQKPKSMFTELVTKYGNFIHPETDVEDDSVGIQPKQIRKWLKNFDIELIEPLIFIMNLKVLTDQNFYRSFLDQDQFISWEGIWNNFVDPVLESNEDNVDLVIGTITKNMYVEKTKMSKEFLSELGRNPWLINFVQNADWKKEFIDNDSLTEKSLTEFFQVKKAEWKANKMQPKSLILLSSRSSQFSVDNLEVIEKLFGSKQLNSLTISDQYYAVSLIEAFGKNLKNIPFDIIQKGKIVSKIGLTSIQSLDLNEGKRVIDKILELGFELDLGQYLRYFNVLPMLGESFIKNISNPEHKNSLAEMLDLFIELEQKNVSESLKEFALSLDSRWLKYVMRYYSHKVNINQLNSLFNIWEKRSKDQNIPKFKGKSGSYEFEMIDKTKDKESLFLGYATDCCQVHDGAGLPCLISGLEDPNETFFVVKKKNRVYAQSWVWVNTDSSGKKFLCFDSIEVLGKDLDESKDIMQAYLEAGKILMEKHGYDYIITGADGNTIPKGLDKFAQKTISFSEMRKNNILYAGNSSYTDIKECGIFVLQSKSKENKKD